MLNMLRFVGVSRPYHRIVTSNGAAPDGPSSSLRIALTSFYLPSDSKIGVGWAAHRLANQLARRGHAVTMFSPAPRSVDAEYEHVQVHLRGKLRLVRWAWACRRLDLSGFDALIAQGEDHLVRRDAVPVHIRTLHGSCFDEALHMPFGKGQLRMLYIGLTELVSAIRTPLTVGVSWNSIRWYPWLDQVIPNGVDGDLFHPGGEKEADPTILFVGTYERRKRGRLLAEVFEREVLPVIPNAKLWMVCSDAPGGPGIEVLGRISDEELADRYRRAWVFCLPSTYEGFGVPYAEALVSGTPVVATPNRGAREVLQSGGGVVCPEAELGASLIRLLSDRAERARRTAETGSAGRQYMLDRVAESYEKAVAAALAGR
jgi:phosphatidylinositol alpha-mannosyltransferase